MSWSKRWLAALGALLGAAGVVASPSVAWADPPGPTDFSTVVTGAVPAGVEVEIVAGDSFLHVTAGEGVAVSVPGYQGEPFVEFLPDGEVRENRGSPSYWLSRSKDGASVPAEVTADSPPDWVTVARDGSYAWHDHRTHLMGAPTGARGDVVWRGTVPLAIDGTDATLSFETTWLAAASPLPALAGAIVGLAAGALAAAWYRHRPPRPTARVTDVVLGGASAGALAIGIIQFVSVPRVTGPPWTLWVLPLTALLASGLATRWTGPTGDALRAVAGTELVLWALPRRTGLTAAVLPTDAPFWLDRSISAAAGVVGLVVAATAVAALIATITAPPTAAHHG